jgi:hypothetical protein
MNWYKWRLGRLAWVGLRGGAPRKVEDANGIWEAVAGTGQRLFWLVRPNTWRGTPLEKFYVRSMN